MAIELIEENELTAQSRMGNDFSDQYSNFLGINKKGTTATAYKNQAMAKLTPINAKMTCDQLSIAIEQAQAEMDSRRGMITAGAKSSLQAESLKALEGYIAEAKQMMSSMQCEKQYIEQEKLASQQETVDILQTVTSKSTDQTAKSKTNTYIIYGIGGLLGIAALFILFKPSAK